MAVVDVELEAAAQDAADRLNQVEDILRSLVTDFPGSIIEAVAESALKDLQHSHAAVQLLHGLGIVG